MAGGAARFPGVHVTGWGYNPPPKGEAEARDYKRFGALGFNKFPEYTKVGATRLPPVIEETFSFRKIRWFP